ncbi:hypothetical protein Gohar_027656 [Gossypium harknessii]|uniref:Disease resistance protein winged helix domain-containing protein n=1 Tax=Gossypium harknessii TaxID=34285 RepID=A0A7J9HWW3_9ROSI|nr:hypothetical protein [Gossypium harknessii]
MPILTTLPLSSVLTDDGRWNLLCRKAFPSSKMGSQCCSEELEKLGKEMVKKCGGLPLAIVVLGGLLAIKQLLAQWEMVHKNIHGHLKGLLHQDHQYEDWEISKSELIQLWIAEGFISPSLESKEILMEDVGEQFLEELIDKSLVQVWRRDYTGTKVKTCQIRDLLRDLCTKKAKEEKFLEIIQQLSAEFDVTLANPML